MLWWPKIKREGDPATPGIIPLWGGVGAIHTQSSVRIRNKTKQKQPHVRL